jgi:hypothetical protein
MLVIIRIMKFLAISEGGPRQAQGMRFEWQHRSRKKSLVTIGATCNADLPGVGFITML